MIRVVLLAGALAAIPPATTGCGLLFGAATLPADSAAAVACVQNEVEAGVTNFIAIQKKCIISELAIVVDIVESILLGSPKWTKDHPGLVEPLRDNVRLTKKSLAAEPS